MFESMLVPVFIFLSCTVIGIVLEKRIVPHFEKLARKSSIAFDDIIIKSLKGMFLLWSTLAGIYFAIVYAFYDVPWISYVIKVIIPLAIISVSLIIGRMANGTVRAYSRKVEGILPSTTIFSNLTKLLVFIIGALILLQYLGISITPILTALGVGGLAVALALQDTLSNIFAGLQILLSRQLKLGDYIRLDSGEEGYIADISWRNTSIRTMTNSMILISNAKLSGVTVVNHDLPGSEISVIINIGISYTSDLDFVECVATEVAVETLLAVPGGVTEYKPSVRFHTFSDYSINFNVILRAKTFADQYLLKHEFIKRLHKRFQEKGIEIPFPVSTVHLVQ